MKRFQKEQQVVVLKNVLKELRCDFCDRKSHNLEEGTFDRSNYEVDEVTISHKTGSQYPEGGSGERVDVDCCGECFEEKVLPLLRSIAVRPLMATDWDS